MPGKEDQKKQSELFPDQKRPPWSSPVAAFWSRFGHFGSDVLGVFFIALSLMLLLAYLTPSLMLGSIITRLASLLAVVFGWGKYFMLITGVWVGIRFIQQRAEYQAPVKWKRVFALEMAAFCSMILMALLIDHDLDLSKAGKGGGLVGWGLVEVLRGVLGRWGTGILAGLGTLLGITVGLDITDRVRDWLILADAREDEIPAQPQTIYRGPARGDAPTRPVAEPRRQRLPPEFRKQFKITAEEEKPAAPPPREKSLPPLELLGSGRTSRPSERHINTTAGLIEKTLAEFGIPAQVVGFQIGPTVTQFAVKPGYLNGADDGEDEEKKKVRVSKITSLKKDLALALSARQLRIEAPVPGRPYIGIEVPNKKSSMVRLRPILESEEFYRVGSPLAIALGRDVSGAPVVADLAQMPHLLIAGTTGSGKSVCITALTTCLVMNNTPDQLRLVMIDPKMVELVRFNGLPHLYGSVETDLERILGVLQWVVAEMDKRYKFLEETSSRNIDTYNRKAARHKQYRPLPRIVVMIDELADLMMMASEQTEHSLVRLAQMARATGIHLVVATQRPSTDVVTGLIKANFPARLSFAVASGVDSRVILDTTGAESLLGNGDMLFLPPESGSPIRAQGAIVTNKELDKVINAWSESTDLDEEEPPWEEMLIEQATLEDYDDLVKDAFRIVRNSQRASTSMIQRKLKIGYPRAARLMDDLEQLGYVGPSQGSGREREVFIAPDEEFQAQE